MKKVIFDVGHPAQVHNFKHLYWDLKNLGWEGLFTAKDKEVTISLLRKYNLPFVIIGKTKKGLFFKSFELVKTIVVFFFVLVKFKPNIVVCRFSPHSCWSSWLLRVPIIGLADTEHTNFLDRLTVPLATAKFSAFTYDKDLGQNHFRFNANIELFYLHPKRFKPKVDPINILNIEPTQKYVILRFVSWVAHHDIGEKGLTLEQKLELVNILSAEYKIFITSENELPQILKQYQINISPENMHDVLKGASLYLGEGASMASEAACLGVPAFYINTLSVGYVTEEVQKGLAVHSTDWPFLKKKLLEFINNSGHFDDFKSKHQLFISEKIDPSAFLVWFLDSYPKSLSIIKLDPDYQYNFK